MELVLEREGKLFIGERVFSFGVNDVYFGVVYFGNLVENSCNG